MTRTRAIGAAVVVCALLAVAFVSFVSLDAPRAERTIDGVGAERAQETEPLAATELARTAAPVDTRAAAVPVVVAEASDALVPVAVAPHLVVTRAGAPLIGAHVELWSEPRDGEAESFEFTSDGDGRVRLPEGLESRGPWFALADGDGACSIELEPQPVDPQSPSTELRCVDMAHVAIVFERSDGMPAHSWPGVRCSYAFSQGGCRVFDTSPPSQRQFDVLHAAGLDPRFCVAGLHIVATVRANTMSEPTWVLVQTKEPDTQESTWRTVAKPLGEGGDLQHVALTALTGVEWGFVDVQLFGGSKDVPSETLESIEVHLSPLGDGAGDDALVLVLRDGSTRAGDSKSRLRLPVGRYQASLDLGFDRSGVRPFASTTFEVCSGGSAVLDFDISNLGGIELPASVMRATHGGPPTFRARFANLDRRADFDVTRSIFDDRPIVVPSGRYLIQVWRPEAGWLAAWSEGAPPLLDLEVASRLASAHAICGRIEQSAPPDVTSWTLDVRPGARTRCHFVAAPEEQEER